jgi:hypothetical protein
MLSVVLGSLISTHMSELMKGNRHSASKCSPAFSKASHVHSFSSWHLNGHWSLYWSLFLFSRQRMKAAEELATFIPELYDHKLREELKEQEERLLRARKLQVNDNIDISSTENDCKDDENVIFEPDLQQVVVAA